MTDRNDRSARKSLKRRERKRHLIGKVSLKFSLAMFILAGVVIAVFTFLALRTVMNRSIETNYMSVESQAARELRYRNDLQRYVDLNKISSKDTTKLSDWVRSHRYLYMLIYKDEQLFYSSDKKYSSTQSPADPDTSAPDTDDPADSIPEPEPPDPPQVINPSAPSYEQLKESMYEITLNDGTVFVHITDSSETLYYNIANVISIGSAMILFALVIVLYFVLVVTNVSRLAADVNRVSGGDMDYSIRNNGKDEISKLSQDVDKMRTTILYNLKKEREARAANEELITSISHDIRTPLTVLLGYLDIMKNTSDDPQMNGYIKASENTALRLKNLSDDMFNYFLIFGNKSDIAELQEYDAGPLLEQLLSEHILLLRELGYTFNIENAPLTGLKILTDAPNVMRIIDNLFSNLKKYADMNEPIGICCRYADGYIKVSIKNKKRADSNDVESNGIGLKTCKKLAELLSIEFAYTETDGYFEAILAFLRR